MCFVDPRPAVEGPQKSLLSRGLINKCFVIYYISFKVGTIHRLLECEPKLDKWNAVNV